MLQNGLHPFQNRLHLLRESNRAHLERIWEINRMQTVTQEAVEAG